MNSWNRFFLNKKTNIQAAAMIIRTAIKAMGPKTSTLARININELPQIAARVINNIRSNNFKVRSHDVGCLVFEIHWKNHSFTELYLVIY